jgi:hypothetical protein
MLAWEHWRFTVVIILLVQGFVLFLMVMAIWKRVINIETLIRLLIRGRFPRYFYPEAKEKQRDEGKEQEIDEETKKILEEMGWGKGIKGDNNQESGDTDRYSR